MRASANAAAQRSTIGLKLATSSRTNSAPAAATSSLQPPAVRGDDRRDVRRRARMRTRSIAPASAAPACSVGASDQRGERPRERDDLASGPWRCEVVSMIRSGVERQRRAVSSRIHSDRPHRPRACRLHPESAGAPRCDLPSPKMLDSPDRAERNHGRCVTRSFRADDRRLARHAQPRPSNRLA